MQRNVLGTLLLATSCLSNVLHAAKKPTPNLPKEWEEIATGGDTACSRNTPYSFFVSKGKSNKVVIDFIGGGACWDAETCSHDTKTFLESIDEYKRVFEEKGIYARNNNENPLKDWTHVIVPYCTGDLHWGSNDKAYFKKDGSSFQVMHRGAINTKAVLKWVQDHNTSPDKILVTGFSAGAYASAYWLPRIRETYPRSTVMQFGDAGISPITESFAEVAFAGWNVKKEGPTWVPGLDTVNWNKLQIAYVYEKLMNHYPDVPFAHYTTAFDGTQRGFFWLMHGDTNQWPDTVKNTLQTLGRSTQFHYFTSPGSEHGVLSYGRFYDLRSTDNVKFLDWFKSYIAGESIQNHDCVNCIDEDKEMWVELRKKDEVTETHYVELEFDL